MKKEIADRWVNALRSGLYSQGRNRLLSEDGGYCCLGVLCAISGLGRFSHGEFVLDGNDSGTNLMHNLMPPGQVCEWAEARGKYNSPSSDWEVKLSTEEMRDLGIDKPGGFRQLSNLNDSGIGFDDIANIIEKHWEEL